MGVPFEVGGHQYRVRIMDARLQFHVARKLAGVMAPMIGGETGPREVLEAFANMPDDAADYVLDACLSAVERQDKATQAWAAVAAPGGQIMFEDLHTNLAAQMQLVWPVVQENVAGFLSGLPKDWSDKVQVMVGKLSS